MTSTPDTQLTEKDIRDAAETLASHPTVTDVEGTHTLEELTVWLTDYDSSALEPVCNTHEFTIARVSTIPHSETAHAEALLEFTPTSPSLAPPLSPDDITLALTEFIEMDCTHAATYTNGEFVVRSGTYDSTRYNSICGWFNLAVSSFADHGGGHSGVEYRFTPQRQYEAYDADTIKRLKRRDGLLERFLAEASRPCQNCDSHLDPQSLLVSTAALPETYASSEPSAQTIVLDNVDTTGPIVEPENTHTYDSTGAVIEYGWQCTNCSRTVVWPTAPDWLIDTFDSIASYDPQNHPESIQSLPDQS